MHQDKPFSKDMLTMVFSAVNGAGAIFFRPAPDAARQVLLLLVDGVPRPRHPIRAQRR